jgi:hypothetical protein
MFAVAVLTAVCLGWSRPPEEWTDVSGTVRYKGKALKGGTIQFLGSDGATYPATIGVDGTYRARVRVGEARVLVSCIDGAGPERGGGKNPALTVSVLRETFSRIIELGRLTLGTITRELNETLRRKEEARIYHWHQRTGQYPPRRAGAASPTVEGAAGETSHPP